MSTFYIYRLTLIHQTDVNCANQIIQSQQMIPGKSGLFGPGIYWANTIEAANLKSHRKGVYICADVYLGKTRSVSRDEVNSGAFNQANIRAQGYTAICGHKLRTGREFVVFDTSRIHNIKYILGTRPQSVFQINRERIVLFFTTSAYHAKQIVEKQQVPRIDGPFGHICYLYHSIQDALAVQPQKFQETFLAADVLMLDFYRLQENESITSDSVPCCCQTMLGIHNGLNYFMIKNRSLVKNIHYCGGKTWN